MARKLLILGVIMIMIFSLTACSSKDFELSANINDSRVDEGIITIVVETKNLPNICIK